MCCDCVFDVHECGVIGCLAFLIPAGRGVSSFLAKIAFHGFQAEAGKFSNRVYHLYCKGALIILT